ncbi:WD40-repeat-containing domain protein [Entophlyctis helioformis]|nr:WD40-repeat-containing domain protein [Entophlyctis helioformis]
MQGFGLAPHSQQQQQHWKQQQQEQEQTQEQEPPYEPYEHNQQQKHQHQHQHQQPRQDLGEQPPVTLCELNRVLLTLTSDDDPVLGQYTRAEGVVYPHVVVPADMRSALDRSKHHVRPLATLPSRSSHPLSTVSKLLASLLFDDEGNLMGEANASNASVWSIQGITNRLLSPLADWTRATSARDTLGSPTRSGPISGLAWHPFKQAVAITHRNDSVHVFDLTSEAWCPREATGLHHEFQRGVSCIAWNPAGPAMFAVGCTGGVCLWRLQFDAPSVTPSSSSSSSSSSKRLQPFISPDVSARPQPWMSFLRVPHFQQVSCLAWSPDGRMLVAGSSASSALAVWDTATETVEILQKLYGATREISFSPDGQYLLQAYRSSGIRVWETKTWESVLLATKKAAHSLNWLPRTRMFSFVLEGDSRVAMMQMAGDAFCLETISTPLTRIDKVMGIAPDAFKQLGGVRKMVVSPLGERMIMLFQDSPHPALFAIDSRPLPDFKFM